MAVATTPLTLTQTPTFAEALALAQERNWVCYTGTTSATWSADKLRPSKAGVWVHGNSVAKIDAKRIGFDAGNVDALHSMLAVRCGALQSGLFVLDFDVHGKPGSTPGASLLETPQEIAGALLARARVDDTVMVRTPSTGLHAYYRLRPGTNYKKQTNCPLLGAKRVDVIGLGQALYFAGSSYDGLTYERVSGAEVKEVPDWLHALFVERGLLLDAHGAAKVLARSEAAKKGAVTKTVKRVAAERTVADDDEAPTGMTTPADAKRARNEDDANDHAPPATGARTEPGAAAVARMQRLLAASATSG